MKLSIIIPIYNVENYIRACLESIFRQGLEDDTFEVILINDGTSDKSMEIIQDIIDKHDNIIVVNQENQGLSVARNVGISMAKGDYIFMPDSDDLVIESSLSPLLEKAIETKVDLVVANFLIMNDTEIEKYNSIIQNEIQFEEKTGEQLFLGDLNPRQCYVWRILFRRLFILDNHISFIPGAYFQDVPFTHECYLKASKCIKTSRLLNIYRKGRIGAATSSYSVKKGKDLCKVIAKTWELTKKNNPPKIQSKLKDDIFTSFTLMVFLATLSENRSDRLEVINYMKQLEPDLFFPNGLRQILYSFSYKYMPHSLINLRYLYGKIIDNKLRPFYYHWLKKIFLKT